MFILKIIYLYIIYLLGIFEGKEVVSLPSSCFFPQKVTWLGSRIPMATSSLCPGEVTCWPFVGNFKGKGQKEYGSSQKGLLFSFCRLSSEHLSPCWVRVSEFKRPNQLIFR